MYAIQNRKTKKFVYGTDYRYYPRHQRTAFDRVITYDSYESAKHDFIHRGCGKDYQIVAIKVETIDD